MFIGRESELRKLNELYHTDRFQFPVIYGRRRVGKTALINEFIKDKEAIFFTGIESNERQNLVNLSNTILGFTDTLLQDTVFPSFQSALEHVFKLSMDKRIVFVIDEYPYIAKSSESFASILQALIDNNKDNSKLYLILCGSSMSFMENQVMAYKSPLYGRRTAQFKILPFGFFESRKYFRGFNDFDMAFIYGMVGGTPQYLLQIDDDVSLEENVKKCFLDASSSLFEEPGNLLKQEVREPGIYNAIIHAIATGSNKLSEISSKTNEVTSVCAAYISNLISLGVIKKEMPYNENTTRKTIYRINDNLFRFWYRFIPDNIAAINRQLADSVYKKIAPMFNEYMGAVFEDICMQYLWILRQEGKVDVEFMEIGRWWGNDKVNKREVEIDIMGVDDNDAALFGECKWTNEKVDMAVLDKLTENSQLFHYKRTRLYLFAKTGFTKGCIEKAGMLGNVELVGFEEMMKKTT